MWMGKGRGQCGPMFDKTKIHKEEFSVEKILEAVAQCHMVIWLSWVFCYRNILVITQRQRSQNMWGQNKHERKCVQVSHFLE